MNLRLQAEADMRGILNDADSGFGWPITLTDPNGNVANLVGQANDIGELQDLETGTAIAGRIASIALAIADITGAGLAIPEPVEDGSKKPFIVNVDDINGNPYVFKVDNAFPDRMLGIITCHLELYTP